MIRFTRSLKAILAGIPMPVLIVGSDYRVIASNQLCHDLFGQDPLGAHAIGLLRQAAALAALDDALKNGKSREARFVLSGVSGELTYALHVNALPDLDGAVLSFEDRTAAEESDAIRRNFVANISHELRTPLTSLAGFIETLQTSARDDPQARERFLEIMANETQRMARMVSDLLSLSRVEVDERVRPKEVVDLVVVLSSVIATLQGRCEKMNVTIERHGEPQEARVRGARDQLIQLFLNLLENAIKYGGSDRSVHVRITELERDPILRGPAWAISIEDEGEGIDEIHLPRLTERFYRVDEGRSRDLGGTGLGLAIVKHILSRHRGRLKVTSKQGVGSCFTAIIPQISDDDEGIETVHG